MDIDMWVGFGTAGLICAASVFRYLTQRIQSKQ